MTQEQERHAEMMRLRPQRLKSIDSRKLPPRVRMVLKVAAEDHGISTEDILSGAQHRPIVEARRQVIQTLRRMDMSFPQIGRYLGRHHTTCMAAAKAATKPGKYVGVKATWSEPVNYPDFSGEWAI